MANFWIGEGVKVIVFFALTFALGKWLVQRGVKVNYTRKIFHFVFFFFPVLTVSVFPYEFSIKLTFLSGAVLLACLSLMYQPIREKSKFLSTAYSSIDRPEDRPYTLVWVSTQLVATYIVLILMLTWLEHYDRAALISITWLIAGIGDGLAEPVGVRFGKRAYQVHALFTDRKYTRTIEGSLCVLFSGFLAVALHVEVLNQYQFILSLLIIPIAMTFAEAFSPHTWDGPFLYLVGGASTVVMLEIAQLVMGA